MGRQRKETAGQGDADTLPTVPAANPNELQVSLGGKTIPERFAEIAVEGIGGNAATLKMYTQPWMGELGLTETAHALRAELALVKDGDLSALDTMLYGQARALEAVFHAMMNRAHVNLVSYPATAERFMRLGLKAQSQCRTTLETLAEIKNPRPVAFVRQANIANGPQQVNNGPRGEESESAPNELEGQHGYQVAAGTPPPSLGADKASATVVEIDRAAHARRKGTV